MSKVKRKLTTILATDCVGFSRRMEEDEELTLENLKACRSLIDPLVKGSGGRIFYTAGDSVIAEFESFPLGKRQSGMGPNYLKTKLALKKLE